MFVCDAIDVYFMFQYDISYIVPGVGLKDFLFLTKIVCKQR